MTEETDQTALAAVTADDDRKARFRALIAEGLSQSDVLTIMHDLNEGATSAEIEAARDRYAYGSGDDVEIDDNAITSRGDGGLFVMAWVYLRHDGMSAFDTLGSPLWGITVPDDDSQEVTAIKLNTYEEAQTFAGDLVDKSAYLVLADDEDEALALGAVYGAEGGPASLKDAGCEEEALSDDDEVYYLRRVT